MKIITIILFAGLNIPLILIEPLYQNFETFLLVIVGWQLFLFALISALDIIKGEAIAEAKEQWDKDLVAFHELYIKKQEHKE
jgi:hypothetical protein